MSTAEPDKVLYVTRVQIEAAKLQLALDKSDGVESDPRVVAIANAKRRRPERKAS